MDKAFADHAHASRMRENAYIVSSVQTLEDEYIHTNY